MAERIEGLLSVIAPEIVKSGIPKRILELEKQYGKLDWRVALTLALEIAQEKFCKFQDKLKAIEIGIRAGLAYLTMGIVASPLEGFVELKINKRKDGKDYFCLMYSGPIRSAGGTGGAVSVVVADYVRKKMGYDAYDPTEEEAERMVTELYDYHERVTNLQYLPSKEEIKFLAKNLPVQISGDPSEKLEVSKDKDLPRIGTNRIRSGACLVMGECLAQKATKVWAQLSKWGQDFDLGQWSFLSEYISLQKKIKSKGKSSETKGLTPVYTYIEDLPAGRPVLTYPLRKRGFRLRYGRTRVTGYSAAAIHPATMWILNQYIAIGTQLKVERPGKAASITACDSIWGPIVRLKDGSVIRVDSLALAKKCSEDVEKILFLGDILFNYGDFFNRAHPLIPAGYCEEWWVQELEKATVDLFGALDLDKLAELVEIPKEALDTLLKEPLSHKLKADIAINLSRKLNVPLYPRYTYYWTLLSVDQLSSLIEFLTYAKIVREESKLIKIIFPLDKPMKELFELIGLPHAVVAGQNIVVEGDEARAFAASLGFEEAEKPDTAKLKKELEDNREKGILDILHIMSKIKMRDNAGTFIGARMGRPEKAKMRKLTGSPHVLFPVAEEGGKLRCFQSALEAGKITAEFPLYKCVKCNKETIFPICEQCGKQTTALFYCNVCGLMESKECPKHGKTIPFKKQEIDINHHFQCALKKLGFDSYPDLIKGVRGTSNKCHIPEPLIKGIIRAKHDITVNKDGTTRYDMTQLPITHFKPKEINVSVQKLKELGYERDVYGKDLTDPEQILELKIQDVILPMSLESPELGADKILFKTTLFIDELLEKLYGLKPFYNLESPQGLIGHLIAALAPHTSAAIVGRIIGFSQTQGFFAHPMLHAATRRDCDGDEACVTLLMDVLLNFSRQFLPDTRGATQDAPLVLTSELVPTEVDDMVFDLDVAWRYHLDFYEACSQYKNPREIKIDQVGSRLGTEGQYGGFGFTHPVSDINSGVKCSAYKTLPSMEEKLKGQMDIADKIVAVDASDVARLVIEKHFLRDIKGNLRKFSQQQFRCVNCNEKFRRPPLVGKCTSCGGRIIFTVSEGSIIKYLEPAISLAKKYALPSYLHQTLELTKIRVESIFGKDKEKQEGLGKWFG